MHAEMMLRVCGGSGRVGQALPHRTAHSSVVRSGNTLEVKEEGGKKALSVKVDEVNGIVRPAATWQVSNVSYL